MEKVKEKLKNSDEEERHELIEEYHLSEEIFQLRKEITNLRKELVFAEDEFEADELNSIIGDLEQEVSELRVTGENNAPTKRLIGASKVKDSAKLLSRYLTSLFEKSIVFITIVLVWIFFSPLIFL